MAKLELTGMQELLDKVAALGPKASSIENAALKAAAEPMAEEMRNTVRVSKIGEQHIKDDIKISKIVRENGIKVVKIGPSEETAWRAKFLEFGTSKMPAYPFMSTSYERNKDQAEEIIKNTLKGALEL